jgi:hypothetical protein
MESSDHPTIIGLRKYLKLWPGALLLVIFLAIAIYNSFLCDDAFITFRYARNLANGLGPVFNAGERVEGYTDFLWMILLSGVIKLGGSPERWSQILAIAFSLGTILIFLIFWHFGNYDARNKICDIEIG